ncbi:dihydrofolate reductase [Pseudoruegeria sp. SK021]|uniref:dihydrofolate reductase n=1 Tax=Pseudoruegeria sp. SK021 TaxID=1933035 RepID=UPI000A227424|nr:dihydrofolate reductase [Pseudoruegeria sp. SK021]OSP54247.1 dihydrofolate reductase [Pseudoruegeria sp. SK021]
MITLIVARDANGAIGREGTIPWDVPEDLKSFQRETLGGALIMGRNTWDSLPVKPLARRLNIVVSSRPDAADTVVPSVEAAVKLASDQGYNRIYGIGGARIYQEMVAIADRLLISEIEIKVEGADTYFPKIDLNNWRMVSDRPLRIIDPKCRVREFMR